MGEPSGDEGTPGSGPWWELRLEREAKRRPRVDGLTIARIIEMAIKLVDTEGLEQLTVRRLADELGTGSASLYRHVASRDELLVLMVDDILGEVQLPSSDLPGRDKVVALSTELRRVLMAHPNLLPALTASPLLGPNAQRGAENGLANLLDAGYAPRAAVPAYLALIDYVLGTVYFDTSRAGQTLAATRTEGPSVTDDDGSSDGRRAITAEFATLSVDDVFSFGLTTFLDGLEQHHGDSGA